MDKENVAYFTLEYSVVKTNNDIPKFVFKCIKLEKKFLSEVTQTQKDKHCMYSVISGY